MDRNIITVPLTAPLADIIGKLLAADVKRLLVVDDDERLAGIVTDSDIVARIDPEERPGLLTLLRRRWSETAQRRVERASGERASDLMTSPAVAIADTASVIEALTLSVERHVKRLPVVDSAGRPVGVVSRNALLAASLSPPSTAERP
jgi:CBS domain-containing protein